MSLNRYSIGEWFYFNNFFIIFPNTIKNKKKEKLHNEPAFRTSIFLFGLRCSSIRQHSLTSTPLLTHIALRVGAQKACNSKNEKAKLLESSNSGLSTKKSCSFIHEGKEKALCSFYVLSDGFRWRISYIFCALHRTKYRRPSAIRFKRNERKTQEENSTLTLHQVLNTQ